MIAGYETQLAMLDEGLKAHPDVWQLKLQQAAANFDLAEYLRRWTCLFAGGPPVVSQPPLRRTPRAAERAAQRRGGGDATYARAGIRTRTCALADGGGARGLIVGARTTSAALRYLMVSLVCLIFRWFPHIGFFFFNRCFC